MDKFLHYDTDRIGSPFKGLLRKSLFLSALFTFCYFNPVSAQLEIVLDADPPSCGNFTDGKINAAINGGTQPYDISWNNGHDGLSLIGIGYGSYSITVVDAAGDTATAAAELTGPDPIEPILDFKEEGPCLGPPIGITVAGSGGVPPYTYEWDDGSTDAERMDLEPGVYCATVTDAQGCKGAGCITVPLPFSINVIAIPPLCPAGCDGAVVVEIFGGARPYDILWNNGVTTALNPNLLPGTYSVTVTDANGCVLSGEANIPDGEGELAITDVQTVNPTCGEGGSISLTVAASNPPVSYMWDNGATTSTISDLAAGTYGVTVSDRNGCKITDLFRLIDEIDLAVDIEVDFVCGDEFGSATATATGGTPPYTYKWNNGQDGPTATNLTPGELYKVSVTDDEGCTVSKTTIIADIDEFEVDLDAKGPSCNGFSDGRITAIAPGDPSQYTFLWDNGRVQQTIDFLRAGTYSVTVSDENGCGGTATIELAEPEVLEVDVQVTNALCGEPNSGSATAIVTGGTPPYFYNWTNGGMQAFTENLGPGFHSILVTDVNGCELFVVFEVMEENPVEVSVTSTNASCEANTGTATAVAANGEAPYAYIWNTGATTASISDLAPGTYTVTATDANGCSATGSVEVGQISGLTVQIEKTDNVCNGESEGTASATLGGGVAPFTYTWSNGASSSSISGLPAGIYSVTVTDNDGCQAITSATIEEPPMLVINIVKTNVDCIGESTGSISAQAFGGVGSFDYRWNTGATTPEITDLPAGTYSVTVTDKNGCELSESATIEEPESGPAVKIQVLVMPSAGKADGSLQAVASEGTPPYAYAWNDGQDTEIASNLAAGNYSVTVTDANGCIATDDIVLNEIKALVCVAEVTKELSTTDGNDGAARVMVEGGTPPYTYSWSNGATESEVSGLGEGTFTVTVTDADGLTTVCSVTLEIICINVDDPGEVGPDQVLCGPGIDAAPIENIELASGGNGPIEYLWMKSTNPGPFNAVTWDIIPDSNSPSYDPGVIYETTYFARCARVEECPTFLETSIVTIFVDDVAVADIRTPDLPICRNQDVSFSAFDNGQGATYLWDFGPGSSPRTSTEIEPSVSWDRTGTRLVTLTVEKDGCVSTDFVLVALTENAVYCGSGLVIVAEPMGNKSQVAVEWEIEKEIGKHSYTIKRTPKMEKDFSLVGRTIAAYDSTETAYKYRFVDNNPMKGRSYYQVNFRDDFDNMVYSNVDDVAIIDESLGNIYAYPNPFKETFTVERVNLHDENAIQLDIRSASGRHLYMDGLKENEFAKIIDLTSFPSGVYFIRSMKEGEDIQTFRLVKVNH